MKIGMTYDLKGDWENLPGDPLDASAEFDKPETVDMVAAALTNGGHTVKRIGHVRNLLAEIDSLDVDIVFNMCEGRNGRNRESQVPVLLEMHNIPFVGADALTLGITLDKAVAKKIFIAEGIPTPRFFQADSVEGLEAKNTLGFPLIVKTSYEGTSKGISEKSRVEDYDGLRRQVSLITKEYRQPALVEEFIKGRECTVPVIGNGNAQAQPIIQVCIEGRVDLGDDFYTHAYVSSQKLQYICPARFSRELTEKVQGLAVKAYKAVGCRDMGRVDFRIDEEGKPYVLEINPLPSLEEKDAFNLFPKVLGTTYDDTINSILNHALKRYGLDNGSPNKRELKQAQVQ